MRFMCAETRHIRASCINKPQRERYSSYLLLKQEKGEETPLVNAAAVLGEERKQSKIISATEDSTWLSQNPTFGSLVDGDAGNTKLLLLSI